MTLTQERNIAIADGARKILSGEYGTPSEYFNYFVDTSLFKSASEYSALVWARVMDIRGDRVNLGASATPAHHATVLP